MITVGQKLFFVKSKGEIMEVTVEKVGRKYFYVSGWQFKGLGFDLQTLRYTDKDSTQFSKQLFLSKEEIVEKQERAKLRDEVDKFFYHNQSRTLSTEQLRAIKDIIDAVQKS